MNDLVKREQNQMAVVEVESQRAVAEVQASMMLARKFPRDMAQVADRIIIACQRPKLAEQALYAYAKDGSEVTGPSVRLAEAIVQIYGNAQFGVRELSQQNGESTVESYAWDLESNVRQTKTFQVPHMRYTKTKGNTKLVDPRDIYEHVASQGARRMRACILGIIPGDIVESAVNQCEETLKASADTSPEAIKKMITAFEEFHVTREMIEKRLQRKVESITAAQMVALRKVYNSLKDGMSNISNWFDVPQATTSAPEKSAEIMDRFAEVEKPLEEIPKTEPQVETIVPESENQDVESQDKPVEAPETPTISHEDRLRACKSHTDLQDAIRVIASDDALKGEDKVKEARRKALNLIVKDVMKALPKMPKGCPQSPESCENSQSVDDNWICSLLEDNPCLFAKAKA